MILEYFKTDDTDTRRGRMCLNVSKPRARIRGYFEGLRFLGCPRNVVSAYYFAQ